MLQRAAQTPVAVSGHPGAANGGQTHKDSVVPEEGPRVLD